MAKKNAKPILSELRIKAAEIYNKLYTTKDKNGLTLVEAFETDELGLTDPDAEDYMELIMEVEMIEDQIKKARRALIRSYGYDF